MNCSTNLVHKFNHNEKKKPQDCHHPRVKIYYLKNKPSDREINHNSSDMNYQNSLSCLSSFIQKQKGQISLQNTIAYLNSQRNSLKNQYFTNNQKMHTNNYRTAQQKQNQIINQNNKHPLQKPQTSFINSKRKRQDYNLPEAQNNYQPKTKQYKRLIKTSQENYHTPLKVKNQQQVMGKELLCNIVKQWNQYTDRRHHQKLLLSKRRAGSQIYKRVYSQQQKNELKKNKQLMKQHFNLFLQDQKLKPKKRNNQKSSDRLKAISQRQEDQYQKSGKYQKQKNCINSIENLFIKENKSVKVCFNSSKNSFRNPYKQNQQISKSYSLRKNKNKNINYFRLLQGPQVKLNSKIFQKQYKIRNFNWTKLDQKIYQSQAKKYEV